MAILYTNDLAGKQAQAKDRMIVMTNEGAKNLKGLFQSLFNQIWSNPLGLTPQEVFDAHGTNAGSLFTLANALGTFLVGLDATYIPPSPGALSPPKTYVINPDGTVTVS